MAAGIKVNNVRNMALVDDGVNLRSPSHMALSMSKVTNTKLSQDDEIRLSKSISQM